MPCTVDAQLKEISENLKIHGKRLDELEKKKSVDDEKFKTLERDVKEVKKEVEDIKSLANKINTSVQENRVKILVLAPLVTVFIGGIVSLIIHLITKG